MHLPLPLDTPSVVSAAFEQLRSSKITQAQDVYIVDPLAMSNYEKNSFCSPSLLCALKTPHQVPLQPIREKYFTQTEQNHLKEMYEVLYGSEQVSYVPLQYNEFSKMKVLGEIYTSVKSRSERSAAILAAWPSVTGRLSTDTPQENDLRIGIIQFFFLHTPHIKKDTAANTAMISDSELVKKQHIFAKVFWLSDHPRKLVEYKNGILMAATIFDSTSSAEFIPVSRIISRVATVNCTVKLDYGEDKVTIAVPLKRPLAT